MIVVMEEGASEEQIQAVIDRMVDLEFTVHRSTGLVHTVLGGVGPEDSVTPSELEEFAGVKQCLRIIAPYKLASRHFRPSGTVVTAGSHRIGADALFVIASGAAAPSTAEMRALAEAGVAAIECPATAAATAGGMLRVVRVAETADVDSAAASADILYVPGQAMQQRGLLAALGALRKPVVIERGLASTVEELLAAAEVVLAGGNYDVILCEAGIRTFLPGAATLDVGAVPVIRKLSHLPVIVDPCRGSDNRAVIAALARAAVAAGADGLVLHLGPPADAQQVCKAAEAVRGVAAAVGRRLP